jgi:Mg2+ and Co2+ transporter CorA
MTAKSSLPSLWELPEELRSRLGQRAGRQRVLSAAGHLLLVLHAPPKSNVARRRARYFWRRPDGSWISSNLGTGVQALDRHLSEYAELIEHYDEQDEGAEAAEDHFAVLRALAPLHRSARHMHQTLQEARQLCREDRHLLDARDRAYEIERAAELAFSDARHGLDFTVARRAEQQAKSSFRMAVSAHRLNLLAAFFFPLAALSALFGMNVQNGMEKLAPPVPFLVIVLAGMACGFVLRSLVSWEPRAEMAKRAERDRLGARRLRQAG